MLRSPTSKSKEVVNFALFSTCILTKAVPLFSGHFLRYESSKVFCVRVFQAENAQKLRFPIISCLELSKQEVAQKTEF